MDRALYGAFGDANSRVYVWVSNSIILVIFYTIAAETVGDVTMRYRRFFQISEYFVIIIFAIEYGANIYVARDRWSYVFSV